MKILITTDLFSTDTNGVVTSVKNLYSELKSRGHDVRILTVSSSPHSYRKVDVTYIRSLSLEWVYPNVRMPISYHHKFIKELIEWSPDVIHSQCEFFSFRFARHISKKTRAPIIHTYHTMYDDYVNYVIPGKRLGKDIVHRFIKTSLKHVSTIVAPTHKVKQALLDYGVSTPISVIPTGIDLDQHQQSISEEEIAAKRHELGLSATDTVLLNLGRLGFEKNVGELLELFAAALRDNEGLKFLIVGDGPAKASLEEQAEALGISQSTIFTGMVPPQKVQNYYKISNIFVSASTSETQGLTYIEAAACALPLLCRADPCLTDIIVSGENGYEYNNKEEFLSYLNHISKDTEWRVSAAEKSREISSNFSKKIFGERVEKLYISTLGGKIEKNI